MPTKEHASSISWAVAALTVPIELLLAIPTLQYWEEVGVVGFTSFTGFENLALVIGLFGLLGFSILVFAALRARRLGELPANKALAALFALALLITSLQVVVLLFRLIAPLFA